MNSLVFDFRVRLAPRPGAAAELLSTMDSTGITRAAVAAGGVVELNRLARQIVRGGYTEADADNEAVLTACADSYGRLVPFYFGNPHTGADGYRDQVDRFRGLELSPAVHGLPFNDSGVIKLVEVAAMAGHPVYTVCLGRPGMGTADLVKLARAYPEVSFVFGHCGHIGIDTAAIAEIADQPNILAETSGCFTVVVRCALDRLGPERVLFGTEYPLQHPDVELAKYRALRLDASVWRQVAWANAHRLIGDSS